MKFRKDFVTNSSSSSYTCDICGATESGWDISLEEAGMVECVNGHTICNDELLEIPRKELIKKILESGYENKRRKKLYDSEYVTEVCKQFDLNPVDVVAGLKKRFVTYRAFSDYIRR